MKLALTIGTGLLTAMGATAARGAVDWTASYEAGVVPQAADSISYNSGNTGSFASIAGPAVAASVTDDKFLFSTIGGGSLAAFYTTSSANADIELNSDIGYTFEWRVRMISASAPGVNNAAALQVDEDRSGVDRFWNLEMYRDEADAYYVTLSNTTGESVVAPINLGEFYTYRVTVTAGGATLYINDNPLATGSIGSFRALATNNIRFGDLAGPENAEFETDYLRIFDGGAVAPVPEPTATAFLGLMTSAALLRRRRR